LVTKNFEMYYYFTLITVKRNAKRIGKGQFAKHISFVH
jgi:hypothetical protein